MEFSIQNPFRFRGSDWAINRSRLWWLAPEVYFRAWLCLSTNEDGGISGKLPVPHSLTHRRTQSHTHTPTPAYTHTHDQNQMKDWPVATYLSHSMVAFLMAAGAGWTWLRCQDTAARKLCNWWYVMMCVFTSMHISKKNTCEISCRPKRWLGSMHVFLCACVCSHSLSIFWFN